MDKELETAISYMKEENILGQDGAELSEEKENRSLKFTPWYVS